MALTDSQRTADAQRLSLADLPARIKAWLADDSHHSVAQRMAGSAFLIRVASAGLIYLSHIAFARWMGSHEFGIYVYVWTWLVLIGSIAPLGISYLTQRFIPEYTAQSKPDLLRGFLRGCTTLSFGLGLAASIVGGIVLFSASARIPAYYMLPFAIALCCMPAFALNSTQDGIARSYNWIGLALIPPYVAQPVAILIGLGMIRLAGGSIEAVSALALYAVTLWITVTVTGFLLRRRLSTKVAPGPRQYDFGRWMRTAMPVFLVESFFFLLTHTDILVLQLFVTPERTAIYFAAVKTMALVAFIHFAISAAYAHRFSESHVSGDRERLAACVADATRWTFWPSLVLVLCLLSVGKLILMLFGPDFSDGYPLICILAVGLLARASVGPAERLLTMLGEQRVSATVYGAAFALNLVLCFALVPLLGPIGAAMSTAAAMCAESALLFLAVRRRLGLNTFVAGQHTA